MRALAAWLAASALASLGAAFAAGGESAAPFGFNAADEKEVVEEKARDARLAAAGGDLPIGALGSGSDYTPFLQHLEIGRASCRERV